MMNTVQTSRLGNSPRQKVRHTLATVLTSLSHEIESFASGDK
jgi:hypothetical protein